MSGFDKEEFEILADVQLALLAQRADLLRLTDDLVGDTRARCKSAGVDFEAVHKEWLNECLQDTGMYSTAVADPDAHFRTWIDGRLADPFRVSFVVEAGAMRRIDTDALRFNIGVWAQEIAWAHRLRRSRDATTVILSDLFLRHARNDTAKQFNALLTLFLIESESFEYMMAKEHTLSPLEIRAGQGSESFTPLFLRHAKVAFEAALVAVINHPDQEKIVDKARLQEEQEMQAFARERVVAKIQQGRMVRMYSIVRAAIDLGLDSDWLLALHEVFVEQVRRGEIPLPMGVGLPHSEFLAWLRLQRLKWRPERVDPIVNQANAELATIVERPRQWINELPDEYRDLGARNSINYKQWISPIVSNRRHAPVDFALDYGFHLVALAMQRRVEETSA